MTSERTLDVIVVGGGIIGLSTGMLLARDGHRVRVLERDPQPPPADAEASWRGWERRGVSQFRQLHGFLPRFRELLEAEFPDVAAALVADGALRINRLLSMPEALTGGLRPGDDRFTVLTGRRPVVEATIARLAAGQPGLDVCRGVAVRGLLAGATETEIPHVVGVITDAGEQLRADVTIDAGGRRSPLPTWLEALGASAPIEELEDSGFVYYCRHFRSHDGSVPPLFGPPVAPYCSISLATLPADNGTWGVGIVASASDTAMRAVRDPDVWGRVVKSYPLAAHWLDGEPLTGVEVMAGIHDRHRTFWVDGVPIASGVMAVGDAWACTNPSVGRGASIGLLHAVTLRDVLRDGPVDDPLALIRHWHEATASTVEPLVRDTMAFDRHRLAEMEAEVAGVPYVTEDPAWLLGQGVMRGAGRDPDLLRAASAIGGLLERGVDLLADPALAAKAAAAYSLPGFPGPTRPELVGILSG